MKSKITTREAIDALKGNAKDMNISISEILEAMSTLSQCYNKSTINIALGGIGMPSRTKQCTKLKARPGRHIH